MFGSTYQITKESINELRNQGIPKSLRIALKVYIGQEFDSLEELKGELADLGEERRDIRHAVDKWESQILDSKKVKNQFWLTSGLILLIIIFVSWIVIHWPGKDQDSAVWGQFGDSFGVFTSLFSALAFLGLILSITMQRKELSLQRRELSLTRQEMESQRREFKGQKDALQSQTSAMNKTLEVNKKQLDLDSDQFDLSQSRFTIEHETYVSGILTEMLEKDILDELEINPLDQHAGGIELEKLKNNNARILYNYLEDYFKLVNKLEINVHKKKHEDRLKDYFKKNDHQKYNEIINEYGENLFEYFQNLPEEA